MLIVLIALVTLVNWRSSAAAGDGRPITLQRMLG